MGLNAAHKQLGILDAASGNSNHDSSDHPFNWLTLKWIILGSIMVIGGIAKAASRGAE
jgi:hypothetical protein